jgi:hypothetical protein
MFQPLGRIPLVAGLSVLFPLEVFVDLEPSNLRRKRRESLRERFIFYKSLFLYSLIIVFPLLFDFELS